MGLPHAAPARIDFLGEEVVPVLREEFAALRPAHVPDDERVAAEGGERRFHGTVPEASGAG
jgi:hypothetical protein